MSDSSSKLAVLVHHNNEVTVYDERGIPHLCSDCRFSGWLTGWERQEYKHSRTCLLFSGGADTRDGDRIIIDGIRSSGSMTPGDARRKHNELVANGRRKSYPLCSEKNADGKCSDYIKAKPLPWWGNFWKKLLGREWRTRRMRL